MTHSSVDSDVWCPNLAPPQRLLDADADVGRARVIRARCAHGESSG